MINFIKALIHISLYSVAIFIGIMLFRVVFKKQVSPKMLYLVWFLLIARLVMPITLETGFHLVQNNSVVVDEVKNNYEMKNNISDNSYNKVESHNNVTISNNKAITKLIEKAKAIHIYEYLFILWLIGLLTMLGKSISDNIILHNYIKENSCRVSPRVKIIFNNCKHDLNIKSNIRVIAVKGISSPAITVRIFPIVLIPKDLIKSMDDQQLELSIKHELMHSKRKDNLVYVLIGLLKAVYWFNPIIYLMDKYMKMDIETACDSMVVSSMKKEKKMQYATTILNMYARNKEIPLALGMSLETTKKSAERRIKGIYMRQQSSKKAKIIATILSVVMLVGCFTTACQPEKDVNNKPNENNITNSEKTPVTEEIDNKDQKEPDKVISDDKNKDTQQEKVISKVELHEGVYFDDKTFGGENRLKQYCEVAISNITDTSFDFIVYKVDDDKEEREVIFSKSTAVFVNNGKEAICKNEEYTLNFTFPDYHGAYPIVTDMEISGFEPLEGNDYVNNGIPGHEFG